MQVEILQLREHPGLVVQQCDVRFADWLSALCAGDEYGIAPGIFLLSSGETVTSVLQLGGNFPVLALDGIVAVVVCGKLELDGVEAVITLGRVVKPGSKHCLILVLHSDSDGFEIAERGCQEAFLDGEEHRFGIQLLDHRTDLGAAVGDILLISGKSLAVLLKGACLVPQGPILCGSAFLIAFHLLELHRQQSLPGHKRNGLAVILAGIFFQPLL